jgi:hypothetical protein
MVGEAEYPEPSILYSTENPLTAVTDGSAKSASHVFDGEVITGAGGKTTKYDVSVQPAVGVVYVA